MAAEWAVIAKAFAAAIAANAASGILEGRAGDQLAGERYHHHAFDRR